MSRFDHFLTPSDTFNQKRFVWTSSLTGVAYGGVIIGLSSIWYKGYARSKFHTFNDWGEYEHMDKMGHFLTTYQYAHIVHAGAQWTGLDDRRSTILAVGGAMLFQSSLEVLDAYSVKWGFSWPDMAFNAAGATLFGIQQSVWGEQRVQLKFSNAYPESPDYLVSSNNGLSYYSLKQRRRELYGSGYIERAIKDYNGFTAWMSINPASFIKDSKRLQWLNVAVGYGAENMYGGFENSWSDTAGNTYVLPQSEFPRYRQYYLSLDVDLNRIPTKSHLLKTLFKAINFVKIPAPTLEFSGQKGVRFLPLYW